jgi:hypothetical protein
MTVNTEFELFWKRWPKKTNKKYSLTCFKRALKRVTFDDLMSAVESYKADTKAHGNGEFYCNASTFLNQDRWTDYNAPPPDLVTGDTGAVRLAEAEQVNRETIAKLAEKYRVVPRVEPSQESKDRVAKMARGIGRENAAERWRQFKEGKAQ